MHTKKTGIVILFLMGVVILSGCIGDKDVNEGSQEKTTTSLNETSTTIQQRKTPEIKEPVNKTGKVVITEYSDFECPFCRNVLPTMMQLKATYGDQIDFVFKHFPLTGQHEYAERAAFAAECARAQARFWTYHDMLFANQDKLDDESLKLYAREIGLDQTRFNECLDNNETFDMVKDDFETGLSLGVNSTPTFFIGTRKIMGSQPYRIFEKEIIRAAPQIKKVFSGRPPDNVLSAGEKSCVDGVLNQDEERPDCGGLCKPCATEKDDLVECLNKADSTLYYSIDCPHCEAQIRYFKDSFTLLSSVDCSKERDRCISDGVRGYPTWVISGKRHVGVLIDSIKKITVCG